MQKIPFFYTYIDKSAYRSVKKVLESTYLSEGRLVKKFESQLTVYLGWLNPVAVNSGTSALHLALILAGITAGDEVICPPQTFIATAMVVLYQRAIPVFVDIQYDTGNISPKSIESKISKKTKAIIAVHWGGYPCDLDEIHSIAKRHNLVVIEDAAHAVGASYKGRPIGAISNYTCFSFQAIKHLTTGDGGAVCFKDKKKAEQATILRWFGIDRVKAKQSLLGERVYNIDSIGYKYHLNDYEAALGLANLVGFKKRLERQGQIVKHYRRSLANISGIKLFQSRDDRQGAYWLFGIHVERRDDFIRAMSGKGIQVSVVHQRIDRNRVFGGVRRDLPNQERFDRTQIHIPIHDGLTDEQVGYIIESIQKGW